MLETPLDDVLDEQDLVALLVVDHLVGDLAGQKEPEPPGPQAQLRPVLRVGQQVLLLLRLGGRRVGQAAGVEARARGP